MTATEPTADQDHRWMQRALEIAQRGIGLCSPNPVVGCVILDSNGELCGEGWHEYDLRDHAEVAALKAAGDRARGGTAYVTLEPCNHTGRTGPCTQALIKAGIKRVIAATIDPNPSVAGNGMQTLRAAGIETAIGECQREARRLNDGFACWSQTKRPFVLMKVAMSLDGGIAPPPAQRAAREPFWITGEPAREAVQRLRSRADAVITGIGTVLADDPLLTDRSGRHRRRPLLRVVLDSHMRLPVDSRLVTSAQNDVLVFTVSTDQSRIKELTSHGIRVETVPAENGRVPLNQVLDALGREGILTLLTEAGSRLNTAFIAADLVNRLQYFVASQMMGPAAVPAFFGMANAPRLDHMDTQQCGNDLALTALLHDPWQSGI